MSWTKAIIFSVNSIHFNTLLGLVFKSIFTRATSFADFTEFVRYFKKKILRT